MIHGPYNIKMKFNTVRSITNCSLIQIFGRVGETLFLRIQASFVYTEEECFPKCCKIFTEIDGFHTPQISLFLVAVSTRNLKGMSRSVYLNTNGFLQCSLPSEGKEEHVWMNRTVACRTSCVEGYTTDLIR